MTTTPRKFPAILNGQRTTAQKVNGRWLVGGDRPFGTVSILLERDGRPAWFNLRGCSVRFSDYASPDEL